MNWKAIDERVIGRPAESDDGAAHGAVGGAQDVYPVDLSGSTTPTAQRIERLAISSR